MSESIRISLSTLLMLSSLAFVPLPALAQTTVYWTNGSAANAGGSWAASASWTPNLIPDNPSLAAFAQALTTSNSIVTLDGNQSAGALLITNGGAAGWIFTAGTPATSTLSLGSGAVYVSTQTATLNAALAGTNGLIKSGAGTLTTSGYNTYAGATVIRQGSLRLAVPAPYAPALPPGVLYWLDASSSTNYTLKNGAVNKWLDLSGNSNHFTSATGPTVLTNSINGLSVLHFANADAQRLILSTPTTPLTVFIVCRVNGSVSGVDGLWGRSANDNGIRIANATNWWADAQGGNGNDYTYNGGSLLVNGVVTSRFATGQPQLMEADAGGNNGFPWSTSLGGYFNTGGRNFTGDIGEVLAYGTVLSTAQRQQVENYLNAKWIRASYGTYAILPVGTAMQISAGATLDLNGFTTTIGSLAGGNGSGVTNNNAGLTVGADNTSTAFAGGIYGAGMLTKTGTGILTLSGTNNYSGATVISSGVLALSGAGRLTGTALICIADGALLDASGNAAGWALGSGQTLSNSAASTGVLVGTITNATGTISVSYTNGIPAFAVSNGTLALTAGSPFAINNVGPPFLPGSYLVISHLAGGTVAGTAPTAVSVGGGGVALGVLPKLVITNNTLVLACTAGAIPTACVLTSSRNFTTAGQSVTFTNRVQTNAITAAAVTGTVSFYNAGILMGSANAIGGMGTFTTTNLPAGDNAISAVYSGDGFYTNSASSNRIQTVMTVVTVNAGQTLRTADPRWFGINIGAYDADVNTPATLALLTHLGSCSLRFPGGSTSDDSYHWATFSWAFSTALPRFTQVITNLKAQAMCTVNYGTGSSNEAAAWVAYVNASPTNTLSLGTDSRGTNWHTAGYWASLRAAARLAVDDGNNWLRISNSAPLGTFFKNWEIGNECYGSWETDSNALPHDPRLYAQRAGGYIALMKAVDPTIRIGVVGINGEDSYPSRYTVTNPVTGLAHSGWTPVMLAALTQSGVVPDALIYHAYIQGPGGESDPYLLQSSQSSYTGWTAMATDLRKQIHDYAGSPGTNLELTCTENNSVYANPGKQSTSLVNGLYRADSMAALMQTEFNGLYWWNLHSGGGTNGNLSTNLYGWNLYGDYGIIGGSNNTSLYPTYYAGELISQFVQPGDTVITAASDTTLLSTYAVRRLNGSLTLLSINKDPVKTFTGSFALAGFTPAASAVAYSYGIPQDNAAQTGIGNTDLAQTNFVLPGTSFTCAFAPYSATVLVLPPMPPPNAPVLGCRAVPGAGLVLTGVNGVRNGPCVLLSSTNLALPVSQWTRMSTNMFDGAGNLNLTNAPSFGARQIFYRLQLN